MKFPLKTPEERFRKCFAVQVQFLNRVLTLSIYGIYVYTYIIYQATRSSNFKSHPKEIAAKIDDIIKGSFRYVVIYIPSC